MPELPSITVYCERLEALAGRQILERIRLLSPFLLRTAVPPLTDTFGKRVETVERMGKRIILGLEDDLFLVIHLMIAGRLRWKEREAKLSKPMGLAAFDFSTGTLVFTEASKKKRASLHVVKGRDELKAFDRGGLEVLQATDRAFREVMTRENHTLKRALTDPALLSGIGNAYSDEILFRAKLSPFKQTQSMSDGEFKDLLKATKDVMKEWIERLRKEVGDGFPDKVTAFHPEMAVHGKFKQPCPVCGKPIQRIVYAENEANYCAVCQTAGKLLSDRSLARLLKDNWPKTMEELEARKRDKA
jgi:formamidopyrimidine-DNA glycosylase